MLVDQEVRGAWREGHVPAPREGYLGLEWGPGTAQVDFGNFRARVAGVPRALKLLVVTLPHPNARFCVAMPRERAEVLRWGLRRVLEWMGREPRVLVPDNATEAGRMLSGRVTESVLFSQFRAHYRCESRCCNPCPGNEKGSVENDVGLLRRNPLAPVPEAASEELAGRVVAAGRRCSLTKSMLAEWARRGTPRQVEYLAGYLEAERASRDASKRANLLRRCGLPQAKSFDGYEWDQVAWPDGFGRDDLLSLSFLDAREGLVLMGDVGTGKTHMAEALCVLACQSARPARFFTASSLVDELGFLPLDADGARPLFQVVSQACETQPVVFTTSLELSRWGSVFGDDQMAAAVIDRVVHHGTLLQFSGESCRVRHALMSPDGGDAEGSE